MMAFLGPLLSLLSELVKTFNTSGGPEAINRWLNDKIVEVVAMRASLTPPDQP